MSATKPAGTDAIAASTARSWEEWLAFLTEIGARDMPHPEIAERIRKTGDANGWWSQMITVAFEQHIGRRQPGQRSDGSFEMSVTRTVDGERAAVFDKLLARLEGVKAFNGVGLAAPPRTSITPKRSYWRCNMEDGTGVAFALEQKAPGKVLVAVTHDKLGSEGDAVRWRAFWKDEMANGFPPP
jgi:hypothetical protein